MIVKVIYFNTHFYRGRWVIFDQHLNKLKGSKSIEVHCYNSIYIIEFSNYHEFGAYRRS